jgi:hypothetical protein
MTASSRDGERECLALGLKVYSLYSPAIGSAVIANKKDG